MGSVHFIGVDAHCKSSELKAVTMSGRLTHHWQGPTTIPALAEAIEAVPRPRRLAVEEGAISDWLWRNLASRVDEFVICEPRRNHLIAKEGEKDDPIDAGKLAQLLRGGYVKAVHHPASLEQMAFKQHVGLYHDHVRRRVAEANQIMGYLRRHGVFVQEKAFADEAGRNEVLAQLPNLRLIRFNMMLLWEGYASATQQLDRSRRRLVQIARREPQIRRFTALPGISWIRAATFFVYVDTPWRFKSKSALWKYIGIGLERYRSGSGRGQLHVVRRSNRALKNMILGAAKSAAVAGDNPFADQHKRWIDQGISPRNARRNVARSQATTLWGMWKTGSEYRAEWVGLALASSPSRLFG
jgi:transposase